MHWPLLLVVLAGSSWIDELYEQPLPPELAGLPSLAPDEARLEKAVRDFDRLQIALARWDVALAQAHVDAGDAALAQATLDRVQQRYALVRKAYELALGYFSTNPRLNNYYGEVLYDRFADTSNAVKSWNLAILVDPKYSAPYNNLGIAYCHIGKYQEGLENYLTALQLEPNNPDYLFNLAQTYLVHAPQMQELLHWDATKIYYEAMQLSKKARDLAPDDFELQQDYAMNFYAAENFGIQADWREAAAAWQAARPHAPRTADRFYTWINEARTWMRVPDAAQAKTCLEQALAIVPDSEIAKQLLDEVQAGKMPAS